MNNTQLIDIEHPGRHDVLWGRGGHTTCHPGNVRYRSLAQNYRDAFKNAGKSQRLEIANEIVQKWRNQNPPGRFLVASEKRNDSPWHDVGDAGAVQKVMGSLRQRKPKSAVPYTRTLQQSINESKREAKQVDACPGTDLNHYPNWQQTFASTAAAAYPEPRSQSHPPSSMSNGAILSTFGAHYEQPRPAMEGPNSFLSIDNIGQPAATSLHATSLVSEDEAVVSEKDYLSSDDVDTAITNSMGGEEVPLAAALTQNIFDDELYLGLAALNSPRGGSNEDFWDIGDAHLLSPGPMGSQDASFSTDTFQDFLGPSPL